MASPSRSMPYSRAVPPERRKMPSLWPPPAQRAVQIDAVGPGRHPFHNLVKEDRHMMKCVVHASSVKAGRFPGPHRLLTKCGMQGPQALAGVWGGVPSPVPQHNRRERRERPTGARNAPLSKTA